MENFEYILKNNTFIGIVEDNNDPDRKQRVRIRIPYLHSNTSNVPTNVLPWAHPKRDNNGLNFSIPDINKVVNVTFPSGNLYMPVYDNAEHLNINLQTKIEQLSEEEYINFISLLYNHNTQIFVDSTGLNINHKFNGININENDINVNLKSNSSKINLGGDEADQSLLLGNNFLNWFDQLVNQLYTAYIGNLGAPVIPAPAFISVLSQYPGLKNTKFLSKNIFGVDNGLVKNKRFDLSGQIGDKIKLQSSDGKLNVSSQTELQEGDYTESTIRNTSQPIDFDPGTGEVNLNPNTKDKSGYYPQKVRGEIGEMQLDFLQISLFNSSSGYKNQNKVTTLLKSIQDTVAAKSRGLCSRVTTNAAILLKHRIENNYNTNSNILGLFNNTDAINNTPNSQAIASVSYAISNYNAHNKPLHDWFVNHLGYTRFNIGTNIPRKELVNLMGNKLKFQSGDIAIYWSNSPSSNGMWAYGHIQMYRSRVGTQRDRWASDFRQNSGFIYGGGESWSLIVLKAPNI
jgi:hypothetical protein